jgi:hypothetical protein
MICINLSIKNRLIEGLDQRPTPSRRLAPADATEGTASMAPLNQRHFVLLAAFGAACSGSAYGADPAALAAATPRRWKRCRP